MGERDESSLGKEFERERVATFASTTLALTEHMLITRGISVENFGVRLAAIETWKAGFYSKNLYYRIAAIHALYDQQVSYADAVGVELWQISKNPFDVAPKIIVKEE